MSILIACAIVDKSDFVAVDSDALGIAIKSALLPDFFHSLSHRVDSMLALQLYFDDFLVTDVSFVVFTNEKHPWSSSLALASLLVKINRVLELSN